MLRSALLVLKLEMSCTPWIPGEPFRQIKCVFAIASMEDISFTAPGLEITNLSTGSFGVCSLICFTRWCWAPNGPNPCSRCIEDLQMAESPSCEWDWREGWSQHWRVDCTSSGVVTNYDIVTSQIYCMKMQLCCRKVDFGITQEILWGQVA